VLELRYLNPHLVRELDYAVARGRELHPVFAATARGAAQVVFNEAMELVDAADREGIDRQRSEAMDVAVTAMRFLQQEYLTAHPNVPAAAPKRDRYATLAKVLQRALEQAATGKGEDRHGSDEMFENQVSGVITDQVGLGYPCGQAIKKTLEADRLEKEAAVRELLGAINYLALAIIKLEAKES